LAKYQNRFRYILVDEYQDTNHSQYLIVKALADRFQNVCVVGDDAQSIYAFRGANIENILSFQNDYPNATTYRLEQNYRSSQNIVKAANSIIKHNQNKLDKNVWTENAVGEKIIVHRSPTDGEEGRYVASSIFEYKMQQQLHHRDFAVLYRTNAQSRAMEDALRKRDIPYRVFGGLSFYQRKEIKDVLAYLRLIVNSKDEESLKRVINYPARGIGQTTIDKLVVKAKEHDCSIFEILERIEELGTGINSGTRTKLANFSMMIKSFQVLNETSNAFEIADAVTKKTGLVQVLKKDGTPEAVTRIENIEELLNGIKDFIDGQRELADMTGSLTEFLEDVALISDLDQGSENDDRVSLMSIHMAKGLEFPYVFIVGMEEDLFPSAMSMNTRSELEEERRLFYVALTRAEKQAILTYTQSRYRWGKLIDAEPSRFLSEMDEAYLDVQTPDDSYQFQPLLNTDIFDTPDPNRVRFKKPPLKKAAPKAKSVPPRKNLKPIANTTNTNDQTNVEGLSEGIKVKHSRFGTGIIVTIEGNGNDLKAEIDFGTAGVKKLLLRFAKLQIIK
jgi:DNA helicase-2/ATP-dependent DNA helicase PcrA